MKIIATNRKVGFDYNIIDTYEAGIVLFGSEVKSLRQGRCSIKDSFARIKDTEIFLYNLNIPPYEKTSSFKLEPERPRKLLLHKQEIKRLIGKVQEKGLTLIPVKLYFKKGFVKVELALAKGKKEFDRRREIKEREAKREIARELKRKR